MIWAKYGKPEFSVLNGLYDTMLPFGNARYSGMFRGGYSARRRGHEAQVHGVSKYTCDFFHVSLMKQGSYRHLFYPAIDLDDHPNLTTEFLRLAETRNFILKSVNMNTQNQTRRGREELRIIH